MAEVASRFEKRRRRNRAAILEAAIERFQQQGIRATKLEEICERADVAPRTFFNHFETREHLYEAIAQQRAEQLAGMLEALGDDPRALPDRLIPLLREAGAYLAARPLYRELVAEMLRLRGLQSAPESASRTLSQATLRFVEDGVARGEISDRHRPRVLADILLGTLVEAVTSWCAQEEHDLEGSLADAGAALLDLFTPDRDAED